MKNNRRLSDQVLIMESIKDLKVELARAAANGAPGYTTLDIISRMGVLYSLLDIQRIQSIVKEIDRRDNFKKEAA